MQYFVTGATGFIGRRLVKTLLARRGSVVYFLLRPESEGKVPALLEYWGVGKAREVMVTDLQGMDLFDRLRKFLGQFVMRVRHGAPPV